ncbi:putative transposase [Methylobacterium nodulans ORS 2060]|uniref:Putative transposase n=1 Tax=Methylobacterium nodulans (strain LMG 21967 / CNCM I-2342 / ORS 2060) TaxID=460265 RepID=B8IM87_METNO|nr:putative transposase [Methylobacterium nodulans ORS 2060]
MILNALSLKLKRQAQGDFRGRHVEAPRSCRPSPGICSTRSVTRDIEETLCFRP